MIRKWSAPGVSLMLTAGSFLLALVSIGLGRRLNYVEHLPVFNSLALAMLVLVSAALVVACVALVSKRGRSVSLWAAATMAAVILGGYLLDG